MEDIGNMIFHIFSKFFWLLCVVFTSVFVFRAQRAAKGYIVKEPELASGYRTIIRGYCILLILPWLVMGIGCTIGGIPSFWHFLNPEEGNPFILTWFISNFIVLGVISYWIFFRGGAKMLIKHHNVLSIDTSYPYVIKLVWIGFLVLGIAVLLSMWMVHIPIEKLPYMELLK